MESCPPPPGKKIQWIVKQQGSSFEAQSHKDDSHWKSANAIIFTVEFFAN